MSASNDQSLMIGGALLIMAFIAFLIGLLADRVRSGQRVSEEVLYRVRAMQVEQDAWQRALRSELDELEARQSRLEHRPSEDGVPLKRDG